MRRRLKRGNTVTAGRDLQFERLLFFSDAVFAIAITLLVIEIRLPHGDFATDAALRGALVDIIPNYISFFVSFVVVGRFWAGHHRYFGFVGHWDAGLVRFNLIFLMTIAFMPFPTAVLGANAGTHTAITFYCGWLVAAGAANIALVRYIVRHPALHAGPLSAADRHGTRAAWMPVAIGAAAFAASFLGTLPALAALIVVPPLFSLAMWWTGRRHRAMTPA